MDGTHKHVISDKHRFIYHEIQKCGTRSLLNHFVFKPKQDFEARRVFGSKELKGKDDYYQFTFVRNPFHRLVSAYISKFVVYNQHPTKPGIRHKDLYMHMPFDEFVHFVCATTDENSDVHFKSQHCFIPDGCRVGKMEEFDTAFNTILGEIGLPIQEQPIAKRNATESDKWREYYTDKLFEMVLNRYEDDIDLATLGWDHGFVKTYNK
jgi:hypothetical protein